MAAPAVALGATIAYGGVSTGTQNLTLVAGINANDIIVIFAQAHNTAGAVATAFGWPSGFVNIFTPQDMKTAAGVARGLVGAAWKRADGSEGSTVVSTTHNGATGAATHFGLSAVLVTGCETSGNPFDTPVTNAPNHTTTIDWPAITPAGDERSLVTGFANSDNNANATLPTNWALIGTGISGNNGTGSDGALDIDKRENVTAAGGPYDPPNQTIANTNATGWVTYQIAFKPPATGAAAPIPQLVVARSGW